jgi:hypothetical protein
MTARTSHRTGDTERQHPRSAVSRFWQHCDRYHDLAENFAEDIAIVHPDGMSGRHPGCPGDTECCGCCRTGVVYYEHIPKARHSEGEWL